MRRDERLFRKSLPDFTIEERALDQPILERMEADENRHSAAGSKHARRKSEQRLELAHLVVHGNAQRLKRTRRRIDPADSTRANRTHDRATQI